MAGHASPIYTSSSDHIGGGMSPKPRPWIQRNRVSLKTEKQDQMIGVLAHGKAILGRGQPGLMNTQTREGHKQHPATPTQSFFIFHSNSWYLAYSANMWVRVCTRIVSPKRFMLHFMPLLILFFSPAQYLFYNVNMCVCTCVCVCVYMCVCVCVWARELSSWRGLCCTSCHTQFFSFK